MNIKANIVIQGNAKVEVLPINANSLSTVVEVNGELQKRQLGDISLLPKESYIPGLSVSFPSIFNLNTESLDYNNRSLVVSLKNQLAGTAFMAPVTMNGTPAFRRIVKSDLYDAEVVFKDEFNVFKIAQYNGDVNTFSNVGGYMEGAKNTPVGNGTGNIIAFGHQAYKTSIFSTSGRNGTSYIKVDGDGGIGNWRELYHSGNIEQALNGKYLPLSGGTLTGGGIITSQGNIFIKQADTANATGFFWQKLDKSQVISGIGSLTNGDNLTGLYMGWGEAPWNADTNFFVNPNGLFYKNKPVWHEGNMTHYKEYGLGTNSPKYSGINIDDPKVTQFLGVIPQTNGTLPFGYGTIISNQYAGSDEFTQIGVGLLAPRMVFRQRSNGVTFPWKEVWHNDNLPNPATQDWVTSQGYSKQNLTAGTNIQINGNVISATDTIPQSGGLAMLIAGTDNVGRVWTSKTLNDWVNTKVKPSVLEYTPQKGITNPLWSSNAVGEYSIAIGNYSNATAYNSLALMQGARAEGFSSVAIGEYSQALGSRSVAVGSYVTSINESYSFGFAITNTQSGCVAIGEFNADVPFGDGKAKNNNSETPLFVIGNGLSSMIRSNAKVLYRDGSTRNYGRQYYDEAMRSTIDFTKDNTLVDVKYVSENGGGGLPNNPFQLPNRYVGDVIKNPSFVNNNIPADETLVTLFVEPLKNNNWTPYVANKENFGLVGMYLKSENVVLLRGYYKTVKFSNNTMFSPLWYDFQNDTVNLQNYIPDISKAKYLGTFIDKDAKTIFFNPR